MSILSAIKQQNSSIDDLAALPQAMIMQMAQKKQISEEMLAPILARKAELAEAFARQNALQNAGQTPPTVMEQLMAQNAQAEQPQIPQQMPPQMAPQMPMQADPMMQPPADAGVAQLPVPDRQYAGGGIIAFADGGMSDEDQDYEDALEEADYDSMIERAMNAGEDDYALAFETRHAKGSPQKFSNSGVGIASGRESGDMDARLRAAIMGKESGGKRYDKNGNLLTSSKGAQGEMQVMPATAKDPGFGIKPAQSDDPNELRRVGDEYASVLLRRYRDPKLAMIAYNMGPGATDKWLAEGADPRRLPRETQGYIRGVSLAKGGEVRHFASDGYVGYGEEAPYDPDAPSIYDTFGSMLGSPLERLRNSVYGFGTKTSKELAEEKKSKTDSTKKPADKNVPAINPPIPQAGLSPEEMMLGSTRAGTWEALGNDQTTGRALPAAAEAPKSRLDAYMEKLMEREGKMEKQRDTDKQMALLAAGLGMLGGTSQYAWENIGKGGLAGVQQYGESNKQRAAEQSALDRSMLYANRYQGAEDLARQNAQYNRGMKQQQYNLDVEKHGTEKQKIAINQYETYINNAMKSLDKNPLLTADPVARAAAEDKILNGLEAVQLRRRAFPDLPAQPTFAGFSATERKK